MSLVGLSIDRISTLILLFLRRVNVTKILRIVE